jgi:hypothetical protein
MTVSVMMSVGFGGSFGDATPKHKSCGENSERRTRLGYISQCQIFGF